MSVQETYLAAIADAIRAKEGSTDQIPASSFAERIAGLSGVKTGSVSGGGSSIVCEDLIGAKNAIFMLRINRTSGTISKSHPATGIYIENGEVVNVATPNSSGKMMSRTSYVTFDASTGILNSRDTSYLCFTSESDAVYQYVIW